MFRSLVVPFLACAALLSTLGGCESTGPDREARVMTLYIAPTMVDCVGEGVQRCLLVKAHPDEEWRYFYGAVIGFTYEPGYRYTLLVERRHIPNPPEDGASYEYRLLRTLARDAAPPA